MICVLPLVVAPWIALAQPPAQGQAPPAASSKAIEDFKTDTTGYVIRLTSRPKVALKLRDEPLLHWGNPARNGEDGAVFVWTLDGRPEVIASVFTFRQGDLIRRKHEYHSLAAGPLVAEYQGQRAWAPTVAGVKFEPVADAPPPAATARRRLSQMKTLAREFSASMVDFNAQRSELRLVPQPLIRYEANDKAVGDGALFSFSLGTDPEALLLVEAHDGPDGARWEYAFARFHFVELKGSHKDREVWHVDAVREMMSVHLGSPSFQDSVYATYHVKSSPVEE